MNTRLLALALLAAPVAFAEEAAVPTAHHASAPLDPQSTVRLALAAAPSLDAQRALLRQAKRDRAVAAVDFVPQIELSGTYTRLSDLDMPPLVFGGIEMDNPFQPILDNYGFKATVTWPVSDLFFAMIPAYNVQRHLLGVQEASLRVEQAQIARNALDAHLQLAQVRAGVEVASDAIAELQAHTERLQDLLSAGMVTQADVLGTQAQLAEARAEHSKLVGLAHTAEAHLGALLDVDGPLEVIVPDLPSSALFESEVSDLVGQAKAQRPEIQVLDRLVQAHRATAAAQRGAALPHLAVVGNVDHANPNQRVVPPTAEFFTTWDATVALTWSPNATVKHANEASKAKTREAEAQADRDILLRSLDVQVRQALAEFRAAAHTEAATQDQLAAAEAAFATQSDLLGAGMATAVDALSAEASARRARHALVDARISLARAHVALRYALGTLTDPNPETVR